MLSFGVPHSKYTVNAEQRSLVSVVSKRKRGLFVHQIFSDRRVLCACSCDVTLYAPHFAPMERQVNIYSNIYTYLQIFGPRYKSFIPIFKSFVPSFKSFIPRYKWFEDRYKWFLPRFKGFIPIFKYDYLYLGTNHLYLSSNAVDMVTFTISLWTEANWT